MRIFSNFRLKSIDNKESIDFPQSIAMVSHKNARDNILK